MTSGSAEASSRIRWWTLTEPLFALWFETLSKSSARELIVVLQSCLFLERLSSGGECLTLDWTHYTGRRCCCMFFFFPHQWFRRREDLTRSFKTWGRLMTMFLMQEGNGRECEQVKRGQITDLLYHFENTSLWSFLQVPQLQSFPYVCISTFFTGF